MKLRPSIEVARKEARREARRLIRRGYWIVPVTIDCPKDGSISFAGFNGSKRSKITIFGSTTDKP